MKIDSIQLIRAAMPLVSPYRTAFDDNDAFDTVLVRLTSGKLTGWGEAAPWKNPAYCAECAESQFLISQKFIAPLLLGQDIQSGQQLQDRLSIIKGNEFAKAAFDLAWWDLHAKQQQMPVWKLIGGKNPVVDGGAAFGVETGLDELLDEIRVALKRGWKRIKLKYRPGWEVNLIKAVRQEFPDAVVHIDCNSAYTLKDLKMFQELDQYNLAMYEQPLMHDDLIDHATLQAAVKTPVCLDESITSATKARQAAQIKACRWVNIKLGRVGGLTNALAIHDTCQNVGIPCWVGGMGESAIGQAFNIAMASLPNIKYPSDLFPSERFYKQDLGTPPVAHSGPSQFRSHDAPGIGVEPDSTRLKQLTLDQCELR